MLKPQLIQNVSTHLVIGFLGAGKTTFINQLIAAKVQLAQANNWAVLVNEFGQIGIDAALLPQQTDVSIKEVAGGCICCTSQLPMQIALARLLGEAKPTRLFVEPTGLAHPKILIEQLTENHWQQTLKLKAVVCVLNIRQWRQAKYREQENYQDHVKAADVVVINQGLSSQFEHVQTWVKSLNQQAVCVMAEQQTPQQLLALLDLAHHSKTQRIKFALNLTQFKQLDGAFSPQTTVGMPNQLTDAPDPELPYRYHTQQDGYFVTGWQLPADWQFHGAVLTEWLLNLTHWQRIKGVVQTQSSWLKLNYTLEAINQSTTTEQIDNRLEIIFTHDQDWQALDGALLQCLVGEQIMQRQL